MTLKWTNDPANPRAHHCNDSRHGFVGWVMQCFETKQWKATTPDARALGTFEADELDQAKACVEAYARDTLIPEREEEDREHAADEAAHTESEETMAGNETSVKLKAAELTARLERLVEVDGLINKAKEKKAAKASEFNQELKVLREEQTTLLQAINTGFEERVTQTEAFEADDSTPAAPGTSKPPKKSQRKKAPAKSKGLTYTNANKPSAKKTPKKKAPAKKAKAKK